MDLNNVTPAELEMKLKELAHLTYKKELEWIEAQENYDILEDNKKSKFACIVEIMEGKTSAEKERAALVTIDWGVYLNTLSNARKLARLSRVEKDNANRLYDTCRSILSSKNAERRMT